MLKDVRWANNVKRVLYAFKMSQRELADELDVDPSLVSRWVRGVSAPEPETQKKISAFLIEAQPSLRPPFIERAPGYVALLRKNDLNIVICCSPAWATHYDRTCKEMRNLYLPKVLASDRRFREYIEHDPLWMENGAAFVQITVRERYKGKWMRALLAPIHDSNMAIVIGEMLDQDAPHDEEARIVSFEEVLSDD